MLLIRLLLSGLAALLLLMFEVVGGLFGLKSVKRTARNARRKVTKSAKTQTKARTTKTWQKRKASRSRISTAAAAKKQATLERTSGKKRPAAAAKPAPIKREKYVCNARTREGFGCKNPTGRGQEHCHVHAGAL